MPERSTGAAADPEGAPASGIDPTFDLLDRPIALGGADDVVLHTAAPEAPTLHGRPVQDPRLVEALSVPLQITRAEVLDRVAKLAGVLRVLGADGATALVVTPDVAEPTRTFAVLAGLRIGLEVVLDDVCAATGGGAEPGSETLTIAPVSPSAGGGPPRPALSVSVRNVRSHFEDVSITGGGHTRELDRLMRDIRIEPAAAQLRDPNEPAVTRAGATLTRAQAAELAADLLDT